MANAARGIRAKALSPANARSRVQHTLKSINQDSLVLGKAISLTGQAYFASHSSPTVVNANKEVKGRFGKTYKSGLKGKNEQPFIPKVTRSKTGAFISRVRRSMKR